MWAAGDLNDSKENAAWDTMNKTDGQHYVTIQNNDGRYEERLIIDNPNSYPNQKQKLQLTRYRSPEPPRLMRNIPKFYTAKKPPTKTGTKI